MSYDKENIFAKILKGEIPSDKVFENEHVLSFKDISPKAKTHILICLLYTSPSPRDGLLSRMPSSA